MDLSSKTVNERIPLLCRALGLESYVELLEGVLRLDGCPVYDRALWDWDTKLMAYRYTPLFNKLDSVAILLSWDVEAGWLFRPELGDTINWAPLMPRDDQRNRPDQAYVAMSMLVDLFVQDVETLNRTVASFRKHREIGE